MIHMKCQDLFSEKKKYLKVSSAAVVIGALRVKNDMCLQVKDLNSACLLSSFYIFAFCFIDLVELLRNCVEFSKFII